MYEPSTSLHERKMFFSIIVILSNVVKATNGKMHFKENNRFDYTRQTYPSLMSCIKLATTSSGKTGRNDSGIFSEIVFYFRE